MKKTVFALVIFVIINPILGQNAFYDANKLYKYYNSDGDLDADSAVFDILINYVDKKKDSSYKYISEEFQKNPFFHLSGVKKSDEGKKTAIGLQNAMSSVLGLNVTNFADGVAKFLVSRAKEELSIAFFKKFKNDMEDKKYSDLRILFPQTYKVLKTIDKDIYIFSAYLNTLRESFIKDLMSTYENLDKVVDQEKYQRYFKENPEIHTVIKNSTFLINQFAKGVHAGEALEKYNPDTHLNFQDKIIETNMRSSIKLAKSISVSFKSANKTKYWVPADSVELLFSDTAHRNIYLGLLYQTSRNITFSTPSKPVGFDEVLKTAKHHEDSLMLIVRFIQKIIDDGHDIDEQISVIKSKNKAERDYNDYYKFYEASLDLFEDGFLFFDLPYLDINAEVKNKVKSQGNKWIYVARSAGELYVDARTKNYSSAVLNTVSILDTVLNYDIVFKINALKSKLTVANEDLEAKISQAASSLSKEQKKKLIGLMKEYETDNTLSLLAFENALKTYTITSTEVINAAKECLKINWNIIDAKNKSALRGKILKYGTFMASVAGAQSSDEIANAIESIALPAGSYSVKRNSNTNISVNGFLGYGYYTDNKLDKNASDIRSSYNMNWSFYAPVGVAFSTTFNKKASWGSVSAFIPLIDVGGLANYRLINDSTVIERKITLNDILSPGLNLIYSIPRTPLSFCAGVVYRPTLAYDKKNGNIINIPGMWSGNFSLLIDIPIINLHTRPKY